MLTFGIACSLEGLCRDRALASLPAPLCDMLPAKSQKQELVLRFPHDGLQMISPKCSDPSYQLGLPLCAGAQP